MKLVAVTVPDAVTFVAVTFVAVIVVPVIPVAVICVAFTFVAVILVPVIPGADTVPSAVILFVLISRTPTISADIVPDAVIPDVVIFVAFTFVAFIFVPVIPLADTVPFVPDNVIRFTPDPTFTFVAVIVPGVLILVVPVVPNVIFLLSTHKVGLFMVVCTAGFKTTVPPFTQV